VSIFRRPTYALPEPTERFLLRPISSARGYECTVFRSKRQFQTALELPKSVVCVAHVVIGEGQKSKIQQKCQNRHLVFTPLTENCLGYHSVNFLSILLVRSVMTAVTSLSYLTNSPKRVLYKFVPLLGKIWGYPRLCYSSIVPRSQMGI